MTSTAHASHTLILAKPLAGRTPGERVTLPTPQAEYLVAQGVASYADQPEPEGPPWWTPRTDPLEPEGEDDANSDTQAEANEPRRNATSTKRAR